MKQRLLSDQVSPKEIEVIVRELREVFHRRIDGDVTEFGCFVGTTSVFLADELRTYNKLLWLYDSFEGLPEKTSEDKSPVGEQFQTGELLASRRVLEKNLRDFDRSKIVIKKAWFSNLTSKDVPHKICFAFLDGDYFYSILDPLELVWPYLTPGACVIVDDYANEALPGAAQAVHAWQKKHSFMLRTEQSLAIFYKK